MVDIVFEQASLFKRIVDSVKGLVDEITFNCTNQGIELQAMDVSHVSLIYVNLPATVFSLYRCAESTDLTFSIDSLTKVLRSVQGEVSLQITAQSDEDIEITITSASNDVNTKYRIKRIVASNESVSVPDNVYKASLEMGSNAFNNLIKSLADISESVLVKCADGAVSFTVSDTSLDATTTFSSGLSDSGSDEDIKVEINESCKMSYALRYLKSISGAAGLSNRVKLHFSVHFPLLVEYPIEEGFARFYLAPKVDEDDLSD